MRRILGAGRSAVSPPSGPKKNEGKCMSVFFSTARSPVWKIFFSKKGKTFFGCPSDFRLRSTPCNREIGCGEYKKMRQFSHRTTERGENTGGVLFWERAG